MRSHNNRMELKTVMMELWKQKLVSYGRRLDIVFVETSFLLPMTVYRLVFLFPLILEPASLIFSVMFIQKLIFLFDGLRRYRGVYKETAFKVNYKITVTLVLSSRKIE